MMGLMFIAVLVAYLGLSFWLIKRAVKAARSRGIAGWKFGLPMALVMYHLVFWDWIPTVVVHNYYCEKKAGFWVYKTVDEWKEENPGVMKTLKRSLEPPFKVRKPGEPRIYWATQRFYTEKTRKKVFFSVNLTKKKFYDASTGELLAYSKNYFKGQSGNIFAFGGTLDDIRLALIFSGGNRQCGAESLSPTDRFDQHIYKFWKWGEGK